MNHAEVAGFGTSSWGSPVLDIATAIAILSLAAGFLGWIYKELKDWRRTAGDRARNGALRLLLKILRESSAAGEPAITIAELGARFAAPERQDLRKRYCDKKDFSFENEADLEAAVYGLQWEGKIDFVSADAVAIRIQHEARDSAELGWLDSDVVTTAFRLTLESPKLDEWTIKSLGRLAARVDRASTRELLRNALEQSHADPSRLRSLLVLVEDIERYP